jgi:transcription elongation factor Elf1
MKKTNAILHINVEFSCPHCGQKAELGSDEDLLYTVLSGEHRDLDYRLECDACELEFVVDSVEVF